MGERDDRIAALEKRANLLQDQINALHVKAAAARTAIGGLIPELLAEAGYTPEMLADQKDRLVSTVHWTTLPNATPRDSDAATNALGEELGAIYDEIGRGVGAVIRGKAAVAAEAKSDSSRSTYDRMAAVVEMTDPTLSETQRAVIATVIRLEASSAVDSLCRTLLNACEHEARWSVDHPSAKAVLQRIDSLVRARMTDPPKSFFDAFK